MDVDRRELERRLTADPNDETVQGALLVERARAGEPVRRELLLAFSRTLHEVALVRDPWKCIRTPCCGAEPYWSPTSILADFRISQAALRRCCTRPRQFLRVSFSLAVDDTHFRIERPAGDLTPPFASAYSTETVRTIIRELPHYHAAGSTLVVSCGR